MLRRWSALWIALLLAGCSEAPAAPQQSQDFDEFELDDTPEPLGVIRGIVVDAAIRPLPQATVSLVGREGTTSTTASGAFAFKDLQPGAYFITVAKPGYKETQASTEVVAGVRDPPVVKILLERLPGTEPRILEDLFQGHITCSLRVPAAGFNDGCVAFGNLGLGSTQRKDIGFAAGNIHWLQFEQNWVPSMDTSQRLCTDAGPSIFDSVICGASPIVRTMNQTEVEKRGVHREDTVPHTTYPDHLVLDLSGNLVLEQPFEVISHAFYNFVPPEGWQFGRDGLPVVPA